METTSVKVITVRGSRFTIKFEDGGQDFREWDVFNCSVFDSRPFQATTWCGSYILNTELRVGQLVVIENSFDQGAGSQEVRYRVQALTLFPEPYHKRMSTLCYTSAADLKVSLKFDTDIELLDDCYAFCNLRRKKTHCKYLLERVNQLRKLADKDTSLTSEQRLKLGLEPIKAFTCPKCKGKKCPTCRGTGKVIRIPVPLEKETI